MQFGPVLAGMSRDPTNGEREMRGYQKEDGSCVWPALAAKG
jgi:hypothetical protein